MQGAKSIYKLTFYEEEEKIPLFSNIFPRKLLCWSSLDVFRKYICEGKKQQDKHNLGTHDSEMANAITDFHPAPFISDLSAMNNWSFFNLKCDLH